MCTWVVLFFHPNGSFPQIIFCLYFVDHHILQAKAETLLSTRVCQRHLKKYVSALTLLCCSKHSMLSWQNIPLQSSLSKSVYQCNVVSSAHYLHPPWIFFSLGFFHSNHSLLHLKSHFQSHSPSNQFLISSTRLSF